MRRRAGFRQTRGAPLKRAEALASQAAEDLAALIRAIAQEEGWVGSPGVPDLEVTVPVRAVLAPAEAKSDPDALLGTARRVVREALRGRGMFRGGHVYCFQCRRPDCEHSRPQDPTEVFSGYSTGGRPVFQAFQNWLIERNDPHLETLYASPPQVIARAVRESELTGDLLPGFENDEFLYRVHGEVVVGLLPERLLGAGARAALTVQVVETRGPGPGRRLRLNLLGVRLEDLAASAEGRDEAAAGVAEDLRRVLRAASDRLDLLGRRAHDLERRGFPGGISEGVLPILNGLRQDLERVFRAASRRTHHAETRHRSRERPTGQAVRDALQAPDGRLLFDSQKQTVVVLGPRGRTHIFTPEGRLVTSLVLEPAEVQRRFGTARWNPLGADQAARFRERLR